MSAAQIIWLSLAAIPVIGSTTVRSVAAFTAMYGRTKQRREDARAVLRLVRVNIPGLPRGTGNPDNPPPA